jgi:predicted amidophosphoribosyltransferase
VKTALTTPFVGRSWRQRFDIARTELREALSVPSPAAVRGKSILVFDDVFTDGLTLNEVGRALIRQGEAARVCGVTLARQPFRGAPSS